MYNINLCLVILILVGTAQCADQPTNTHDTIEIDSDDDDNFDVTEQTEPSKDGQTQDDNIQTSGEVNISEEEIHLEISDLEEEQEFQPPAPTHQPVIQEPGQPIQPSQLIPPYQPVLPQFIYQPQPTPIQQLLPTIPPYPSPPLPVLRPIPRYPQGPYPRYDHPRHPPYHPYQRYRPPTQPIHPIPTHYGPPPQQPPPTHYMPPPQQQIQEPGMPYIVLPTGQQIPQPPTIHIPPPQQPIQEQPQAPTQYAVPPQQPTPPTPTEGPMPLTPSQPTETQEKVYKKKRHGRSKKIKFMKKNAKNELVPMISTDYMKVFYDTNSIQFEVSANLEQVYYDGELAYEHKPGRPYASKVTQLRRFKEFTLRCGNELVLVEYVDNKWKVSERKIPFCFEIFTIDDDGEETLIPQEYLDVNFGCFKSFKFTLKTDVRCHKIVVQSELVWEKGDDGEYPVAFSITTRFNVAVIFENKIVVYSKRSDGYVYSYTKSRKINVKRK